MLPAHAAVCVYIQLYGPAAQNKQRNLPFGPRVRSCRTGPRGLYPADRLGSACHVERGGNGSDRPSAATAQVRSYASTRPKRLPYAVDVLRLGMAFSMAVAVVAVCATVAYGLHGLLRALTDRYGRTAGYRIVYGGYMVLMMTSLIVLGPARQWEVTGRSARTDSPAEKTGR
jgi:hypothetical protein